MNAYYADFGTVVGLYHTYVFSDLRFCHTFVFLDLRFHHTPVLKQMALTYVSICRICSQNSFVIHLTLWTHNFGEGTLRHAQWQTEMKVEQRNENPVVCRGYILYYIAVYLKS